MFTKPKEEKALDYESMAKMMQKLSNKIIDLEKRRKHRSSTGLIIRKGRKIFSPNLLLTILRL